MWRRHSIAAKKAAWDQEKWKIYSMMSKIIQLAAKKWSDPKMNPSLELALQKARYAGVPKEIVERAILKWSGQLEWENNMEEIFYEWYWPGWVAFLIKTLTSNTNRTSSNIKSIIAKNWWSLGLPNSVARQFKETWVIIIDGLLEKKNDKWKEKEITIPLPNNFEEIIIELPILDFEVENQNAIIYTDKFNFWEVQKKLETLHYHIIDADLQFIPENMIPISNEDKNQFLKMIEALEQDEDVDKIWHNAKLK